VSTVGRNTMGVTVMELDGDWVASVDVLPGGTGEGSNGDDGDA
jgi:hypothetical protein